MQNLIKEIGDRYQDYSERRNDLVIFNSKKFVEFAENNLKKYNIIEENSKLLVDTINVNNLINDFKKLN